MAAQAWVHGLEAQIVASEPSLVGIDLIYCLQLTIVCWIGAHLMTRGQLLPAWLRNTRTNR